MNPEMRDALLYGGKQGVPKRCPPGQMRQCVPNYQLPRSIGKRGKQLSSWQEYLKYYSAMYPNLSIPQISKIASQAYQQAKNGINLSYPTTLPPAQVIYNQQLPPPQQIPQTEQLPIVDESQTEALYYLPYIEPSGEHIESYNAQSIPPPISGLSSPAPEVIYSPFATRPSSTRHSPRGNNSSSYTMPDEITLSELIRRQPMSMEEQIRNQQQRLRPPRPLAPLNRPRSGVEQLNDVINERRSQLNGQHDTNENEPDEWGQGYNQNGYEKIPDYVYNYGNGSSGWYHY